MNSEAIKTDFEKVSKLSKILTDHATGLPASNQDFEELRHELLSNSKLADLLPSWLKTYRNLDAFWGFIQPKFSTYVDRRKFLAEEFSKVLNLLEFGHSVEVSESNKASFTTGFGLSTKSKELKKVFLVHGHDNESKQEVARYLERIGLEVIILHEQASSGMTIIEKIEHYSNDVDFAIILYTACDLGRAIYETKVHPRNRARQNVIFEHGYLMAKLGRKNVCALVKGEIETPNDISGVVYVSLNNSGDWKNELANELQTCGYTLK